MRDKHDLGSTAGFSTTQGRVFQGPCLLIFLLSSHHYPTSLFCSPLIFFNFAFHDFIVNDLSSSSGWLEKYTERPVIRSRLDYIMANLDIDIIPCGTKEPKYSHRRRYSQRQRFKGEADRHTMRVFAVDGILKHAGPPLSHCFPCRRFALPSFLFLLLGALSH
jgi:hypothetical protein